MRHPPAIVRIRVQRRNGGSFGLPLPLFLLWPVVLALAMVIVPMWLTAALAWWTFRRENQVLLIPWRVLVVICCLGGLLLEVKTSGRKRVCIELW